MFVTTADGIPKDGLVTRPEQFGMFDPSHPLEPCASVVPTDRPGWDGMPEISLPASTAGWSATGLTLGNQVRWVPLLEGRDRYGRVVGTAAATLLHYGGPYNGSVWAYCGLEGDLYRVLGTEAAEALVRDLVETALRPAFLLPVRAERDTYAPEEPITVSVTVRNVSGAPRELRVHLSGGALVETSDVTAPAGGSATATFVLPAGGAGLRELAVSLLDADTDTELDRASTAVVIHDPGAWPEGPALAFRDNGFLVDGRHRTLLGSDAYSNVFASPSEGPRAWARDLDLCRDFGLDVYENLHFPWRPGGFTDEQMSQIEGFAHLAAERDRIYMAGWLIGADTWVSGATLADQAELLGRAARRTRDATHLIHYINGDLRSNAEPDEDGIGARFRAWLLERHGGPGGLTAAWGDELEWPFDEIPYPLPPSGRWDSVRAVDAAHFAVSETRRWNRRLAQALRDAGGGQPITDEYYQMPVDGVDLPQTVGPLDVANIGFFGHEKGRDLEDFARAVAFADSRARGKGINVGEFGVKTHPAWSLENGASGYHIARTKEEERQLFVGVVHLGMGLGVSKFQNWCLRDSSERVFPWGLFHPSDVAPKESAYTYRHLSLLAHRLSPIYEPPEVTLLLPDWHRLGDGGSRALEAAYRAIDALHSLRVPFNALPDTHADRLPPETNVLWWPVPYACSDETRDAVEAFVRGGGRLYVSGDLARDEYRRPARLEAMGELVGATFGAAAPAPTDACCAQPHVRSVVPGEATVLSGEPGAPLLLARDLADGRVVYLNSPGELAMTPPELRPLYEQVLAELAVEAVPLAPGNSPVLAFNVPTADGGRALVLHNPSETTQRVESRLGGHAVRASLEPGGSGLVGMDGGGRCSALSAVGRIGWQGYTLAAPQSGACAVPLGNGHGLAVAAYGPGQVRISAPGARSLHVLGEPVGGEWTERQRRRLASTGGEAMLDLDDTDWTLVHLLTSTQQAEAAGTVTARLICGG
jgi:hypothetical protein